MKVGDHTTLHPFYYTLHYLSVNSWPSSHVSCIVCLLLLSSLCWETPAINKRRRLPATSVTKMPPSATAVYMTVGGRTVDSTRRSQIMVENRDFAYPTCIRRIC